MISFVIPLRAARTCDDWQYTSSLLHRTLNSISRQTHGSFDVIVVCEDLPDPLPRDSRVTMLSVPSCGTPSDWPAGEVDKARRLRAGFQEALHRGATLVVPTDADDCVSRHLVAHATTHPEVDGWRFERGYVWPEGSRMAYLKRRAFHELCGTSMMVRPEIALRLLTTEPLWGGDPRPAGSEWFDHTCPHLPGVTWREFPRPAALYSIYNGANIRMTQQTASELRGSRGRLRFVAERVTAYRPEPARWLHREFGPLKPP